MAGVEGDGGVASPLKGAAALELGDAGQEPAGPAGAPVGGGGKADGGAAAVKEPPDLEGTHNGVAEGEGVGLDLSAVLAGGVGERVAADLGDRDVGEGRAGGEYQQRGGGEDGGQAQAPAGQEHEPHDGPFLMRAKARWSR